MSPEVVEAIGRFRVRNLLSVSQAALLLRVTSREFVSVRFELRVLLYAGVSLIVSGAGLFLKQNHDRIGPAVVASLVGLLSAACFLYAFRRSPPLSWRGPSSSPLAVEPPSAPLVASGLLSASYAVLLGLLLLTADLAYVETQFPLLEHRWPYHLLIVAAIALAAAYRFDSRIALSLALTSFAAWRGVSVALLTGWSLAPSAAALRANALACGALFLGAAYLSDRLKRKPHFAPVWRVFGLLLWFSGLLQGVAVGPGPNWVLWELFLLTSAGIALVLSSRKRRPLDFSIAAVAAYSGFLRILSEIASDSAFHALVAVTSIGVLVLLIRAHRNLKEAA